MLNLNTVHIQTSGPFGPMECPTQIALFADYGLANSEPIDRAKVLSGFVSNTGMIPQALREGISGTILLAARPGTKNEGGVYWLNEVSRAVYFLSWDRDCDFNTDDFEQLHTMYRLHRLIGHEAIPRKRNGQHRRQRAATVYSKPVDRGRRRVRRVRQSTPALRIQQAAA
ncbi:MAG: hypothetical protein FWD64_08330 [Acidobacteriaceae bacterium]|nr:hypothetical protein [Acidobacteriaceae bacterium]